MGRTALPQSEAVWAQLSNDLRRFIRRRVGRDDVADDLLQETFLRVHRNIQTIRNADRVAAGVYRIARNVIHDHYRHKVPEFVPIPVAEAALEASGDTSRVQPNPAIWLANLIDQWPEPYRQAVRLSKIDGLTQREAANKIGLTLSGAKSRVQRGRRMLKEMLDECCDLHFDQRGNLMDCDPKTTPSSCHGCE